MEEQGNENQEHPKQEVPRWQSQGMGDIPSFSPPENEYGIPQQRGGKFGSIGTIVTTVIISLVLCYAMVSLVGISPSMKQYKADITRLELDLVDVRAVDAALNAELDGLANASIIAQNASTTATEAKDLVTTLQTNYTSLNASLTALDNRISDLESNSGDIYDDTIVKGLINAVEDDITAINTTIVALQAYDTTNTTNISALQSSITTMQSQITALQGGGTVDLTAIQNQIDVINHYINDADTVVGSLKYQLKQINTKLETLNDNDLYLQGLIENTILDDANITSINTGLGYYQVNFKINKTGTYAVLFTIYSDNVTTITSISMLNGYDFTATLKDYQYGSPSMRVLILSPDSVKLSSSATALTQWTAGQTYSMRLNTTVAVSCIDIDTAAR